jgi:hypothetical protein
VDMLEAQIFPEDETTIAFRFMYFYWVLTVMFAVELLMNFCATSQAMGSLNLLRVLHIVRILCIFTKLEGLNKLCRALGFALVPMCNAFFLLFIATSVYALFGTHYFGKAKMILTFPFTSLMCSSPQSYC